MSIEELSIRWNSFEAQGARIPEYFKGANADNDTRYNRMTPVEQFRYNDFVRVANIARWDYRKNGMPLYLKPKIDQYSDLLRRENAPINMEDLVALDAVINYTIHMSDVTTKIPLPRIISEQNGGKRWEIKDYLVQTEEHPRFSRQFQQPRFIRMKESSGYTDTIGLYLGVSIPFTEIELSKGGLWDVESILMQECATKMGLQRARTRLLGTACKNARFDDAGGTDTLAITGLYNNANIQSHHAGDGDEVVTTAGDVFTGIIKGALPNFKTVYKPGEMIMIATSGYSSEPWLHRDSYQQQLDVVKLKELVGPGKVIDKWICTDELYNTTPATGEQQVLLIKNTGDIRWVDVFPMQTLPSNTKMYEGDVVNIMIWGGGVQYKKVDSTTNAYSASKDASVDATTTGFIPEGTDVGMMINGFTGHGNK